MKLDNVIVAIKCTTSIADLRYIFGDNYTALQDDDTHSHFEAYGFRIKIKKTPLGLYKLICEENSRVVSLALTKAELITFFELKRIDNWIPVEKVRLP